MTLFINVYINQNHILNDYCNWKGMVHIFWTYDIYQSGEVDVNKKNIFNFDDTINLDKFQNIFLKLNCNLISQ